MLCNNPNEVPMNSLKFLLATLFVSICTVSIGCQDRAEETASEVRKGVDQVREAEADDEASETEPEFCEGISDAEMDEVEAKMARMNQELVVLTERDQDALRCSRALQGQ